MQRITARAGVSIIGMALPLYAQLYVIVGSPTPNRYDGFSASLVRIDSNGTVDRAASLIQGGTPRHPAGLFWISVYHEARKAVLVPTRAQGDGFISFDFDSSAAPKECDFPPLPALADHPHLVDVPGQGPVLAEEMHIQGQGKLVGMLLDVKIPCDQSYVEMAPIDIVGVQIHGRAGVSDTGSDDEMDIRLDSSGKVTESALGVNFPFTVPTSMLEGVGNPLASILVANSRLVAVGIFQKSGPHQVLVYRKRDRTWHRLPIPAERVFVAGGEGTPTPWITGFGSYLALTEARTKDERRPETAGKAGWRNKRAEHGPSMVERFGEDSVVFPGTLHLYDVDRDRSYAIATNQGDSEILLVEDGMVYYRVNDAIYKCAIGEASLGPAQLVAKSEILGDAHWAFIRHQ